MNKKVKCLFPFYAFYYRGDDNKIGACCMQKPMISKLGHDSIEKWWTGPDAQKIRQQFIDGEWPDSCKICKKQEEAGQETIAKRWGRQFLYKIGANYDDIDVVKGNSTGDPFFVDYRPDNFCNLSCSMCNPGASSNIEKMARDLELDFWDLPSEHSFKGNNRVKTMITPNVKKLKINGGEPTINEKIKDIYRYTIDNGFSKNIHLQFTTNFTNFNKTFEMLKEFRRVNVTASLDGTGQTYEYIRTPAKWNSVKNNILKYAEMCDGERFKFSVNTVWFSATAFTIIDWLPELLDFVQENFGHKEDITINQCQTPAFQNLSIIPEEYRAEIYENISMIEQRYPDYAYIFDEMRFGLDWFKFDPNNLRKWQELNPKMDAYKKIDITTLHPRFKDLMNYNV